MAAHIRGLHETGGLSTLRSAGSKADRSKLTAMLSRLEHQRALIERQLTVWTKKQQVTKHRLSLLDKEIIQIGRLIRQVGGPHRTVNQRSRTNAIKSEQQPDRGVAAVRRGDVSLDY